MLYFFIKRKRKSNCPLNHCKENKLFEVVGLKEWIDYKEINGEIKINFLLLYGA